MSLNENNIEYYKIWFKTAKNHLDDAYKNLENNSFFTAYEKSILSAEIALKALLVKYKKFSNKDKTHKLTRLYKKISTISELPKEIINQLDDIINKEGLGYIEISDIDFCTSGQIVKFRYPIKDKPPHVYFTEQIAIEKIQQAQRLLELLQPLLEE
ncbi:MAG: HEPN domain-containing protein [Promethearchaeota archaeon]